MIIKGYTKEVPEHQLERAEGNVRYLLHHGVFHPQKGSLRVVEFRGTTLNSQLLQGPNLASSLVGDLMQFRQETVAVMADVQAMFHQIKVDEQHLGFLRFLWWPKGNLEQELVQYRMNVHLFGAVSSPSVACYALRKAADDNAHKFSAEVTDTVKCNFYVDDLLKSLPSEEDAILMIQDLKAICQAGGFKLTKWFSNSREVLCHP